MVLSSLNYDVIINYIIAIMSLKNSSIIGPKTTCFNGRELYLLSPPLALRVQLATLDDFKLRNSREPKVTPPTGLITVVIK